jgi:anti-anti-sigma factor
MLYITEADHNITVTISGKFDFRLIKDFQRVLERIPRTWIIDLSDVNYVDSSGLGMLLLLREKVNGDADRVLLRGLRGQPRDVFVMAKFDRMFKLVP